MFQAGGRIVLVELKSGASGALKSLTSSCSTRSSGSRCASTSELSDKPNLIGQLHQRVPSVGLVDSGLDSGMIIL